MNEKDVLYVKGKFFTFTRKKFVQDMSGNLLYTVRNKFWTFFVRKALVYDKDGNQVAFMKKKFWSFHDHYFIETKLGQMEIRGNILCFDYHISLKGKEIGHVSRKISLRDSFVLDLDDEYKKELPFFVALVIAIDNITDQRRDDNSSNY
jgi:uncharacterized protein YxjI